MFFLHTHWLLMSASFHLASMRVWPILLVAAEMALVEKIGVSPLIDRVVIVIWSIMRSVVVVVIIVVVVRILKKLPFLL